MSDMQKKHILVVDDDTRLRSLLQRFLLKSDFLVSSAKNANEARARLSQYDFDLIILDIMMPEESGLEFLQKLRQESDVPVILLTAMGETADRIAGLETGADDYLPKPFEPQELILRIKNILRRTPAQKLAAPETLSLGLCVYNLTTKELVAAGGISTVEEIVELQKLNINTQLGMCIYTGSVALEDAFTKCLDFEKRYGYLPTVVQDADTKQVLMLAYSTPESVRKALSTGIATYFSRSRNKLWVKGETSGNTQKLVTARFDCDMDALLFIVKQKGNACHLGRYSCFGDKNFTIEELYSLLLDRKKLMPEGSFTTKLFENEFYLKRKIMEEAFESVNFEQGDGLAWEAADLTYFMLTFMAKHNITPQDILNNLASRTK